MLQNETINDIIVSEVVKMKFYESKSVELKEKYTKSLLKTISAYSNFHDGYIYVGINDQGEVVGLPKIHEEKLIIENSINTTITPKPFFDMNILEFDGKKTLEIKVYKGDNGPYYYQNTAYMRNDTSTVPVDGSNLTRLVLISKNLTYDQLKVSQSNLSFNYLKEKMHSVLNITDINQAVLTTLGLFIDKTYNNCALLLSDNGSVSQSYIDIARFKLDTNTFLDRKRFENQSLLKHFDQSMTYFQTQYPSYQTIEGIERTTKEQVPLVAFREALSNAIIHRDYLLNSGVQISMFENRIEIVSPGGLPEGMDEEQYYRGLTSLSRNPIISNVFFRLNLIEQFGTGIKRILDSYKRYKVKPSFDIQKYQIRIVLPVTNFDYTKLEKKEAILSYLHAYPKSSRQSIENSLKIDKSTLIRRLNELDEQGLVSKSGNGPSTTYYCK
jgi:ATP-dependent DNA helicase RecG